MIDIDGYLNKHTQLLSNRKAIEQLKILGDLLKKHKIENKRILIFGNGASASIASHAALDFTKQANLTACCFHDPALITAFANDYGYDKVFEKVFEFYGNPNDIVILVSVSGESKNIINLAHKCKETNNFIISFTGKSSNNTLSKLADVSMWVDSNAYNVVENIHSIWITTLIDYVIGRDTYEVS